MTRTETLPDIVAYDETGREVRVLVKQEVHQDQVLAAPPREPYYGTITYRLADRTELFLDHNEFVTAERERVLFLAKARWLRSLLQPPSGYALARSR